MSEKESEHIWKTLLEPDLETGQDWCMRLSTGKSAGLDMSGSEIRYVQRISLEPREQAGQVRPVDIVTGRRWLTGYIRARGRTYLVNLSRIWRRSQTSYVDWNCGLEKLGDPDMSGQGFRHVWKMPLEPSEFSRCFCETWIDRMFSMICTSPTHPMCPS
jgi:hypothetical protein